MMMVMAMMVIIIIPQKTSSFPPFRKHRLASSVVDCKTYT